MGNARVAQEYIEAVTYGSGNARVAQQYIEMLATASSEARVAQIYLEAITNIGNLTGIGSNTLSFTQSTNLGHGRSIVSTLALTSDATTDLLKSVVSTIVLSQSAVQETIRPASNTLSLSQSVALALIVGRNLPQSITITQDVTFDHPLGQMGESDLILTQDVNLDKVRGRSVTQSLSLSHVVNVTFVKSVTHTITFTQLTDYVLTTTASNNLTLTQDVIEERYKLRHTFSNLNFTQSVDVTTIISEDLSQTLNLTQTLKRILEETTSNNLSLTQTVVAIAAKNVRQTLTLTQAVVLQKVLIRPVISTLHFTEVLSTLRLINKRMFSNLHMTQGGRVFPIFSRSAHNDITLGQILYKDAFSQANSAFVSLDHDVRLQHIRNLSITHNINLTQNVVKASVLNFNLSDTLTFPEYRTQQIRIGDLTEITIRNVQYSLLHPNDNQATRRRRQVMTLSVPGKTIILPVPHFGDGEGITDSFNMSYAVDGTVYTTVRRSGTKSINFEWDLKYPKAEELKEFIWDNNSKAIRIDNWNGEIWIVRLLTNPIDFTDNLRPSLCESDSSVIVALEFEGVRIH